MKNSYKRGKVHPSPPAPPPSAIFDHHLSLVLPATVFTLTASLSPQDREVLAYLISCFGTTTNNFTGHHHRRITLNSGDDGGEDHSPMFGCNCFRCYMSFWARWDTSPNRQAIHEIIEAYEEGLFRKKRTKSLKKKNKEKGNININNKGDSDSRELNNNNNNNNCEKNIGFEKGLVMKVELAMAGESDSVEPSCVSENEDVEVESEKGTVRKIVSFIGEKIWGMWN